VKYWFRLAGGVRKEDKGMTRRRCKGFTLIELVVVLVIIGILSVIAVPMYRGYIRRAMASEGRALVGTIATGERVYYAQHSEFAEIGQTSESGSIDIDGDTNPGDIDVDARMNTYFRSFQVSTLAGSFTAMTTGEATSDASGISVQLTQTTAAEPVVIITGL
jgi:prepilin-type N-terminal cleavage/methylation domain-containing protein